MIWLISYIICSILLIGDDYDDHVDHANNVDNDENADNDGTDGYEIHWKTTKGKIKIELLRWM